MTREQVSAIVVQTARTVLRTVAFDMDATKETLSDWDSVKHIQLLSALERALDVDVEEDQVFRLVTAEALVDYFAAARARKAR